MIVGNGAKKMVIAAKYTAKNFGLCVIMMYPLLMHGMELVKKETEGLRLAPACVAIESGELDVIKKHIYDGLSKELLSVMVEVAIVRGKVEVLDCLKDLGVRIGTEYGWSPLHTAVIMGLEEKELKTLIQLGVSLEEKAKFGRTPLHVAASIGSDKTVEALINLGAQIEVKDAMGYTPLFLAKKSARDYLLAKGAKQQISGYGGENKPIFVRPNRWTPLHEASMKGLLEKIPLFLLYGIDVEARDESEQTALHVAAHAGHSEVVKKLLENKANIEARDGYKRTPLHVAIRFGNNKVVQALVKAGASIEAVTLDKKTPLHLAVACGDAAIVQELLGRIVHRDAQTEEGFTPLIVATMKDEAEIVEILLRGGAKMEVCDKYGRTALHWAALKGSAKSGEKLIAAGANVSALDFQGRTASMIAEEGSASSIGRKELSSLLEMRERALGIVRKDKMRDAMKAFIIPQSIEPQTPKLKKDEKSDNNHSYTTCYADFYVDKNGVVHTKLNPGPDDYSYPFKFKNSDLYEELNKDNSNPLDYLLNEQKIDKQRVNGLLDSLLNGQKEDKHQPSSNSIYTSLLAGVHKLLNEDSHVYKEPIYQPKYHITKNNFFSSLNNFE